MNNRNYTGAALRSAAKNNNIKFVHAFIAHHKDKRDLLDDVDANGLTALYYASEEGYSAIVKVLASAGANVNLISNSSEATPIFAAAYSGHHQTVKVLAEAGADINLGWTTLRGEKVSPFRMAIECEHFRVVKVLMTQPTLIIPKQLIMPPELKQSILDDILHIQDTVARKTALLNAMGKGTEGKNNTVYKVLNYYIWFPTINENKVIKSIHSQLAKALAQIEERENQLKPALVNPCVDNPQVKKQDRQESSSSTATALQTMTPEPARIQTWEMSYHFDKIKSVLKYDSNTLMAELDKKDDHNQTLRDFLFVKAKQTYPFILYMMLKKNVVRAEDYKDLDGMQIILWKWIQHPNFSSAVRNKLMSEAQNISSPLHQFLARDPEVFAQIDILYAFTHAPDCPAPAPAVSLPSLQSLAAFFTYSEIDISDVAALPAPPKDISDVAALPSPPQDIPNSPQLA
jgi:hypothetical protein